MSVYRPIRTLDRLPRRLSRRAVLWYACAVCLCLVTVIWVNRVGEHAEAARRAYGDSAQVLVASSPIEAGEELGPANSEVRAWPTALVPPGAVPEVAAGRFARHPIGIGQAVLESALTNGVGSATTGRLSEDKRAVSIPVAVAGLPLQAGDRVDVAGLAVGSVDASIDVVARDAEVLESSVETVLLAIEADEVAAVAQAISAGPVSLALRPPGQQH